MDNKFIKNIVYCTALYLAVQNGHKDIVKYISDLPIDTADKELSEFTKIFLGAQSGRYNSVKSAIENMFTAELDMTSCSPIHEAAELSVDNLVKLLIGASTDVDAENVEGYTALQIAAKNGNAKFIEILIEKGANINYKIKNEAKGGKTALHIACEHGNFHCVSKLLLNGADPELKDWKGNAPLYYAVKHGSTNIVKLLLSKGANINALNNKGLTVITEARNEYVINLLLKNGLNYKNINDYGRSILHDAAYFDNHVLVRFLLEKKMDINIEHKEIVGCSPLANAAYINKCNVMKELLKYGASIHSINNFGLNALHLAAWQSSIDAIKLLMKNGADINATTSTTKQTALILAVKYNKLNAVKLLLSHGADVKIKNYKNKNALDYAVENGNQEIIRLLRKHCKKRRFCIFPYHR